MSQTSLFYTDVVKKINKNFLIRYYNNSEPKKTYLTGAGVYHFLVGVSLANKHFLKALESTKDKTVFKLRRGLTIHFISK